MPQPSSKRPLSAPQGPAHGHPAKRDAHSSDEPPLAVRMRQILAEADFPAISKDALDALKLMKDDDASIQRLANIVLREYSLTLKVLRTANSAYYRRSEASIQSATHAMLLLGARTVRHLAASLLVFEHYRKRSPGLKELMVLSLLTANHARALAMLRGTPDPEEAHLCGMFRNLGEVLVAGYFPAEYARILQRMEHQHKTDRAASFEILGLRFEELGEGMALHWGMPESVVTAIRADGPSASSEVGVLTSFAHDLTDAVYRRDVDLKRDNVAEVLTRYAHRLKLTRQEVGEVLQSSLQETKEVFASAKLSIDDLRLRRLHNAAMAQIGAWSPAPSVGAAARPTPRAAKSVAPVIAPATPAARVTDRSASSAATNPNVGNTAAPAPSQAVNATGITAANAGNGTVNAKVAGALVATPDVASGAPSAATPVASATVATPAAGQPQVGTATHPDADLQKLRRELAAELARVIAPASGEDSNRVILVLLEAIYRGGPFDRVVFCMMNPDRNGLKARFGLGTNAEQILDRFSFDLNPREGPIPVAMLRRQSAYVPVERDFTAQELRFAQSLGASSFGVYPVVVSGKLLGCIYCDRPWNARPPDRAALGYVRSLCDGAVRGIEARQSGSVARVSADVPSAPPRVTPAFSAAHKSETVLRLLKGEAPDQVGRELGVSAETLDCWRREFLDGALKGLKRS